MNEKNILIALELLLRYTTAAQNLANLLQAARSQGRDITAAELLDLAGKDDTMRERLDAAIAARAGESP